MRRSETEPRRRRDGLAGVSALATIVAVAVAVASLVVLDRGAARSRLLAGVQGADAAESVTVTSSATMLAPATMSAHHLAPRVIVDPACTGHVAYEWESPYRVAGQTTDVQFVVPADGRLDGLLGALTLRPGVTITALGVPSVGLSVSIRPDGAGVAQWHRDGEVVALLAAKRADALRLRELAESIEAGDAGRAGFAIVAPPASTFAVAGDSCSVSGAFVGVETVSGPRAALIGYLVTVDPTRIEMVDGGLVAEFNRFDGGALPLEVVDPTEWSSRLRAIPTEAP